jgi:hypothetical protein
MFLMLGEGAGDLTGADLLKSAAKAGGEADGAAGTDGTGTAGRCTGS